MNDKYSELQKIAEIVVQSCSYDGDCVTIDKVLGASREENVVLTREILAMQVINSGFTVSTVAHFLNRTKHTIRHLLDNGYEHRRTMRSVRIACEEIQKRLNE